MKSIYNVLFLVFCVYSVSAQNADMLFVRTGQVEPLDSDHNSIVILSSYTAFSKSLAISFAERNALENLLYKGFPGTAQENPMLGVDHKSSSVALDELVSGKYVQFLTRSIVRTQKKIKKKYFVELECSFDLVALRRYLTENNVIRKFGY